MDPNRFDSLARSLTEARSRRALTAALAGFLGLLGLAAPDDAAAAKSGKCKPKCGECEKCNKGDCKRKNGTKRCKKGKCKARDNGTACSSGRTCQNGTCVCPPDKPAFCTSQNVCGQCCDNLPCCGKTACGPQEPICLANLTCGCEDGRPLCGNRCCIEPQGCGGNDTCADPAPSDRNLKTNVASIDPADMLGRVRELPISTWNYTSDDPAVRHIGPMAQDFAALFGVGADDRHIHPIDGQGVALAAIQGLLGELAQVREENARLAARLERLEAVSRLEDS